MTANPVQVTNNPNQISNITVTQRTDIAKLNGMRDNYDEFNTEIGELIPEWEDNEGHDGVINRTLTKITYNDKSWNITQRFLNSFCSKFGVGTNIFKYFTPEEVFARIQKMHPRTQLRVVTNDASGTVLAVSAPSKAYVDYSHLMMLLTSPTHITKVISGKYESGVVTTVHKMRDPEWDVNGDVWQQTFTLATPIDGYGLPDIYISLVRKCSNTTLTASSKTFKSQVQLGKDSDRPEVPLSRAMESYNNEEGFQALRQRLMMAQKSVASLYEVDALYRSMKAACGRANTQQWVDVSSKYYNMTGDPSNKYAIVSGDSISPKKARMLNMNCTVYDLICFMSELTTIHKGYIQFEGPINRWVGNLFDNEYDLEGVEMKDYKPKDFYLR